MGDALVMLGAVWRTIRREEDARESCFDPESTIARIWKLQHGGVQTIMQMVKNFYSCVVIINNRKHLITV